ncbi:hypothetical protein BH24ACI4_BH24ACI4_28480 [soil metagenome]
MGRYRSLFMMGILLLALPRPGELQAQAGGGGLPFDSIALADLRDFRTPGANWRTAGSVTADRNRDRHLLAAPGSGILVNLPARGREENLFTAWEHGDIELELEVLMPRGSNSGIYLQGRYEVQLLDSWGVRNPTSSDIGGIYQRWDPSRPQGLRGFEGHPPAVNASRAPGLWQTFHIRFRAPRFDAAGRKVANARFVHVVHNGVVIHENVELGGPTQSAAFADERPQGPLMLQGDHGPVAFRNIRYKRYTGEQLGLSNLQYRAYKGAFQNLAAATSGPPVHEGAAEGISSLPAGATDRFALEFDGVVSVPATGRYLFDMGLDWIDNDPHFTGRAVGGGRLTIGGREVLVHGGMDASAVGEIQLEAGDHPVTLVYYKNRSSNRSGVSLIAEGPGVERHPLHAAGVTPVAVKELIAVDPAREPVVLRSFVEHNGSSHVQAASIGDPAGVHYAYDLGQGALLYGWRGPFVETTDMWHSRGDRQLALPRGSLVPLSASPDLAVLAEANLPWPDYAAVGRPYRFRGYRLDDVGRPTFAYQLGGVEIEDRIRPAENGTSLHREIRARGTPNGGTLYARVAVGSDIVRERDGSYTVGDRSFYVAFDRGSPRPVVRPTAGGQELLVPLRLGGDEAVLGFTIVW